MFFSLKKTIIASAAVALVACAGPTGPQGEQGPKGDPGAAGQPGSGFEAGPSISAVFPDQVLTGRSHHLQISGFATEWDAANAPTVSFGAGVTVSKVTVASPTALVVDIDVTEGAVAGTRDVTVTDGDSEASFSGAFTLIAPLEVVGTPTASQLGRSIIAIKNNDPSFTLSSDDTDFVFSGADALNPFLLGAVDGAFAVEILPDLSAPTGTQDLHIDVTSTEGKVVGITLAVNIQAAQIADIDLTGGTGTLSADGTSSNFKFTATEAGAFTFKATWDESGTTSEIPMYVVDSTGTVAGILTVDSNPTVEAAAAGDEFYLLAFSNADSGSFTLSVTHPASVTEAEPNDDMASAQAIASVPSIVTSTIADTSDQDWFKITIGSADVGKKIHAVTSSSPTNASDPVITVYAADGTTVIGESSDENYQEDLLTDAIASEGDYFVVITDSTFDTDAAEDPYNLSITLE